MAGASRPIVHSPQAPLSRSSRDVRALRDSHRPARAAPPALVSRRPGDAILAGALAGLAYLVRPEGLGVVGVVGAGRIYPADANADIVVPDGRP